MTITVSPWWHTTLFVVGFTLFMVVIAWLVIVDFERGSKRYAAGERRRAKNRRLVHRRQADADGQARLADLGGLDGRGEHTAPRVPEVEALYRQAEPSADTYPTMPLPKVVAEPVIALPLIAEESYQARHRLIEDTTELPVLQADDATEDLPVVSREPDLAFMQRVLAGLRRLG